MIYWTYIPNQKIYFKDLELNEIFQIILDLFNSNITVIDSKLDEETFSPIFEVYDNSAYFTFELKVKSAAINDLKLYLSDPFKLPYQKTILFIDKELFLKGRLTLFSKNL